MPIFIEQLVKCLITIVLDTHGLSWKRGGQNGQKPWRLDWASVALINYKIFTKNKDGED